MSIEVLFQYTDGSVLIKTTSSRILSTSVWESNRVLDEEHVADLERAIQDPRHIQGLFTVVKYKHEDSAETVYKLIDGQHRREVLKRYFTANPHAEPIPILARMYIIQSWDDARRIFQEINHAKPMVYKGSTTEKLHEIVSALKQAFLFERKNGQLVQLIRPGCNRPHLSTEKLEEALKRFQIADLPLTPDDIVKHAKRINLFYAENLDRLTVRVTQNILDRAAEYGFYLGLDPSCSWLLGLR
jgi:hypothetical protein